MKKHSSSPTLPPGSSRATSAPSRVARGLVIALTALVSSATVHAVGFSFGDIFAAVGNGQVKQYDKNFNFIQTLNTGLGGFTTGMTFDKTGKLYVTDFSASQVSMFSQTNGALLGTFGSGYHVPESILFNLAGNALVGNVGGGTTELSSSGTLMTTHPTNRTDWIDLAKDQKTLVLADESQTIRRFDLSTDTFLPNFATLSGAGEGFALRLLSDGGLLIADGENVKRLDSSGNEVQTYGITGESTFFALNLDPDGKSFFSGDFGSGKFYKFDIATGALLGTIDTGVGGNLFFGLAVYGEKTQGGGGPPPPPPSGTPEPSTYAMFGALGLVLVVVRRRLRGSSAAAVAA